MKVFVFIVNLMNASTVQVPEMLQKGDQKKMVTTAFTFVNKTNLNDPQKRASVKTAFIEKMENLKFGN